MITLFSIQTGCELLRAGGGGRQTVAEHEHDWGGRQAVAEHEHDWAPEANTGEMHILFIGWTGVAWVPEHDNFSAVT